MGKKERKKRRNCKEKGNKFYAALTKLNIIIVIKNIHLLEVIRNCVFFSKQNIISQIMYVNRLHIKNWRTFKIT